MDFTEFEREVQQQDIGKVRNAVAGAIRDYVKSYDSGDRNGRFERFFLAVDDSSVPVRRQKSGRRVDDSGSARGEAYYESIRKVKGGAQLRFVIGCYYWFHYKCESKSFAIAIDEEVFGEPHFPPGVDAHLKQKERQRTPLGIGRNNHPAERTAPQPPLYFPAPVPIAADKSNWLNPSVVDDGLLFLSSGADADDRDARLADLDEFAEGRADAFLLWAVSGPSGAGKTRLVSEWMRELHKKKEKAGHPWNVGFFGTDQKRVWKTEWQHWEPDRPTVIAIDYIHLFGDDILGLIDRFDQTLRKSEEMVRVRLLLLDHVFPDRLPDLQRDPRFPIERSMGKNIDETRKLFFRETPLQLRPEDQDKNNLRAIMVQAALLYNPDFDHALVDPALEQLETMPAARCPLFAALRGRALAIDSEARFGNRRDLIHHYLSGTRRLPWHVNDNSHRRIVGQCIGSLVAAATAIGRVSFADLFACLPGGQNSDKILLDELRVRSCAIVSRWDDEGLQPFEPDILGESFFLLLVEEIRDVPPSYAVFISMLESCSGGSEDETKARKFLEFASRLANNLHNDDQNDPLIKLYWRLFLRLLTPSLFPPETLMRHAASIVLVRTVLKSSSLQQSSAGPDFDDHVSHHLHQIEVGELVAASAGPLFVEAVSTFMQYYCQFYKDQDVKTGDKIILAVENFDFKSKNETETGVSGLGMAIVYGFADVVTLLLEKTNTDVNQLIGEGGATPLILAAETRRQDILERLLLHPHLEVNKAATSDGATALILASELGHEEIVSLLLRHRNIDVNFANSRGLMTALGMAAQNNHVEVVNLLLSHRDIDVNRRFVKGRSAFMQACWLGRAEVVDVLLARGDIMPNDKDEDGWSGYLGAVINNHTNVVSRLLDDLRVNVNDEISGDSIPVVASLECDLPMVMLLLASSRVDINRAGSSLRTGLTVACYHGRTEIVEALLAHPHIDVNLPGPEGAAPIHMAAKTGNESALRCLILHPSIIINAKNDHGDTALALACIGGHEHCVAELLGVGGIEVNSVAADGATPLLLAIAAKSSSIVELLLAYHGVASQQAENESEHAAPTAKVNVNTPDQRGDAPLIHAIRSGCKEVIGQIIKHPETDVNLVAKDGSPPWIVASALDQAETTKCLLRHPDADFNATNQSRVTALMWACEEGDDELVDLILSSSTIDVNARSMRGATALFFACSEGHFSIVRRLLACSQIDVNIPGDDGASPLILACQYQHLEVVEELLRCQRLDPNQPADHGTTALIMASQVGDLRIVERLIADWRTDINQPDEDGNTALMKAVFLDQALVVTALLGADEIDINHVSLAGNTALDIAFGTDNRGIALLILASGGKAAKENFDSTW